MWFVSKRLNMNILQVICILSTFFVITFECILYFYFLNYTKVSKTLSAVRCNCLKCPFLSEHLRGLLFPHDQQRVFATTNTQKGLHEFACFIVATIPFVLLFGLSGSHLFPSLSIFSAIGLLLTSFVQITTECFRSRLF